VSAALAGLLLAVPFAATGPAPEPVPEPAPARQNPVEPTVITVVHRGIIRLDKSAAVPQEEFEDGFTRHAGQTIRREAALPDPPTMPSSTPRITAEVTVRPEYTLSEGRLRPNDPWNRLGAVTVLDRRGRGKPVEVELVRFVTGYGGPGTFTQDVTALAPLLFGARTFDVYVSTFTEEPAWEVTFRLIYHYDPEDGAGYRRPVFVDQVLRDRHTDAAPGESTATLVNATVQIPRGLARPRLRVLTTGHATDGKGRNEFVTSTHVLRIDGVEVARWRPWTEDGPTLRSENPFAGRQRVGERQVRASDYDRAGWNPGRVVKPLLIPTPELQPGRRRIELEIDGIRSGADRESPHGYWVVTVQVVADEPLPGAGPTHDSTRD
jgi:hypothetical protein